MITVDVPEAFGATIFCDDIRIEASGQVTFVGAYAGDRMFIHAAFPVTLPKLAFGISYRQKRDKVVLPIKFFIFLPGDAEDSPSFVTSHSEEDSKRAMEHARKLAEQIGTDAQYVSVHTNFIAAGVPIQKPGLIKVRAVRGDELIRLGTLEVVQGEIPLGPTPEPKPATQ